MPFRQKLPGERISLRIAELSNDTNESFVSPDGNSTGMVTDALITQLLYEAEQAMEKSKNKGYDWKAEMTTCLRRLPSQARAEVGSTFPFTRRDFKTQKRFHDLRRRFRSSVTDPPDAHIDNDINSPEEIRKRTKILGSVSSEVDNVFTATETDPLAGRSYMSPSHMELRRRNPTQAEPVISGLPTPPGERAADDVCYDAESYILAIRIYECQKRPQVVARDLHMWEQRHEIAALTSPQDHEDGVIIPDDAVYLIVLQHITWDPVGSVLFFASKRQPPSDLTSFSSTTFIPMAPFDLKVGYYYDYRESILPWIDTVMAPIAPFPLLEAHSIIRPGITPLEYKQFYNHCRYTINREYQAYAARPTLNWPSFAYEWTSSRRKEYVDSKHIRDALVQQGVSFEPSANFDWYAG